MKRSINFLELLWTMFLYLTLTDFNWVYLAIVVLFFPGYITLYDNAQAHKAHKESLEEMGVDEDGNLTEEGGEG